MSSPRASGQFAREAAQSSGLTEACLVSGGKYSWLCSGFVFKLWLAQEESIAKGGYFRYLGGEIILLFLLYQVLGAISEKKCCMGSMDVSTLQRATTLTPRRRLLTLLPSGGRISTQEFEFPLYLCSKWHNYERCKQLQVQADPKPQSQPERCLDPGKRRRRLCFSSVASLYFMKLLGQVSGPGDWICPPLPLLSFIHLTGISRVPVMGQALCWVLDVTSGVFHFDVELNQRAGTQL